MLTKHRYSVVDVIRWTRHEILRFLRYGILVTLLYVAFDLRFLQIPWTPLAVIGTAVAFIVGFQNNAAYGRIWEARKIWGGVVNTSRTFGMKRLRHGHQRARAVEPVSRGGADQDAPQDPRPIGTSPGW